MARMMPGFCPDDAPPGEKAVYSLLQLGSGTNDWLVLHSLGIAEHVRQVEGEADFVVIIPKTGILVIEVKSHQSINRRADGIWKLGNDAPTARGPFQQSNDAMYSLRNYLEKKGVDLRSLPVLSAVWFTGVRARTMLPPNPEWHAWQVMDSEDLKAAPSAVKRTIAAGTQHLIDKIKYFEGDEMGPDAETSNRIVNLLRPKFEVTSVAGDRRRSRQSVLASFIEEQFIALDAASDNQAILFSGPAGSGKTFLAMESARREIAMGKRGRLMCFNRFLGKRLRHDMADMTGLAVGTFHQEMLRLVGWRKVPDNVSRDFWSKELPERAMEVLLECGDAIMSDFLIIDEIQDIATEPYLDVLDLMVRGGLKNGRVIFFGDFERQAIYENAPGRDLLRLRAPYLASHKLMQNCRNLPRIGYQVNMLSQLQPGYQHFRRGDDGVDPLFRLYNKGQDQSALLAAAIRDLREEGYAFNEIVVLSPLRDKSTAATSRDPWLRQILMPADGSSPLPGQLQYSTIHAFKGLDAPAVVVTDLVHEIPGNNFESLLYIGLTRATDRLIAFVEKTTFRRVIGGAA